MISAKLAACGQMVFVESTNAKYPAHLRVMSDHWTFCSCTTRNYAKKTTLVLQSTLAFVILLLPLLLLLLLPKTSQDGASTGRW
jgi:hypothetical protein